MRWWGWGRSDHPGTLPAHARTMLRDSVGVAERPHPPVELQDVRLPAGALTAATLEALGDALGEPAALHLGPEQRVRHCAGRSYTDLVRLRSGRPSTAPDAVLFPRDATAVMRVLERCARHDVAVVPFGGGTSVVGGVEPLRGEHAAVIALDLRRLDAVQPVDRRSLTIACGAGLRLPALESHLGRVGLTLGHRPQSFHYASVGGCAATRSAGQASTGYGRFDDMVLGLRCATPSGELALASVPATAAGPSLRQLIIGSEGTLGVITEVSLRVHRAPVQRHFEGVFFETFAAGTEALRHLIQHDAAPDLVRLSDESETSLSLALAGARGVRGAAGRGYLRLRGYARGCLAILGYEGEVDAVAQRRRRGREHLRRQGGLPVGRSPGEAWAAARYEGPYLRDDLLTEGVMVETLETAAQWSQIATLHRAMSAAIAGALRGRGTPGLVGCHISHLYPSGCSLYFTFLARQQEGQELEQWAAVKRSASDAIVAAGATITHHHGVGSDHAPWLTAEIGARGVAALQAVKAELDPRAIMNPGKLLPS